MLLYADYLSKFPLEQQPKALLTLFAIWLIPFIFACIAELIKLYRTEHV